MKCFLGLFIFAFSLSTFAQGGTCSDELLQPFVKGPIHGPAAMKLVRFKQLRDSAIHEVQEGDTEKANCLMKFYADSMNDMATFWEKRGEQDSCEEACQSERAKSLAFLKNINFEFQQKLSGKTQSPKNSVAAKQKCEADALAKQIEAMKALPEYQCCGDQRPTKGGAEQEKKQGLVYNIYPSLSRQECLEKIDKNDSKKHSALGAAYDCSKAIVSKFMDEVWENIKALYKLPMELWAAREQLSQIKFDRKSLIALKDNIVAAVQEMISGQSDAYNQCLNSYEKGIFFCDKAGQILSFFANPIELVSFIRIAAMPFKAMASGMKAALSKSETGRKLLTKATPLAAKTEAVAAKTAKITIGARALEQTKMEKVAASIAEKLNRIQSTPLRRTAKVVKFGVETAIDFTPLTLVANSSRITARSMVTSSAMVVSGRSLEAYNNNSEETKTETAKFEAREQEQIRIEKSLPKPAPAETDFTFGKEFLKASTHDYGFMDDVKGLVFKDKVSKYEGLGYKSFDRHYQMLENKAKTQTLSQKETRQLGYSAATTGRVDVSAAAYLQAIRNAKTKKEAQAIIAEIQELGSYNKDWLNEIKEEVLLQINKNFDEPTK